MEHTDRSTQVDEEEQSQPVVITDKRGKNKPVTDVHTQAELDAAKQEMPTADELLAAPTPINAEVGEPGEFEKQQAEEAERIAKWEAMSDEERQEVLAQQAAAEQGTPFAGGGVQTPPNEDAGKKQVLTMFTIVVHRDGTAVASDNLDLSNFEAEFPVDANMMYRAVCEIKKDIESTDAATTTLMFMNQHAAAMQQQAQASALARQLDARGKSVPPRRGRH